MEKQALSKEQKQSIQADALLDLKRKQIDALNGGKPMDMITANRNSKFQIRELESGYVHVRTITKHLNSDQKSFTDEIIVHAIHAREFDRRVNEGAFHVFDDVEVIHDPRENAPRDYVLKPVNLLIDAAGPRADSPNVAAREKHLQAKEVKITQANEELAKKTETFNATVAQAQIDIDERLKKINELTDEAQRKAQEIIDNAQKTADSILDNASKAVNSLPTASAEGPKAPEGPIAPIQKDEKPKGK
jgi:hypothetical protein